MVTRILRTLGMGIGIFVIALLALLCAPYFVLPVYHGNLPHRFEGTHLFSPYAQSTDIWYKADFHLHAKSWLGLTNGRNSEEAIYRKMKSLRYDIVGISNYQEIAYLDKPHFSDVPVYEHGFNYGKHHQLIIGATHVDWLDFPFLQTIYHKQFIINRLHSRSSVLVLAHPEFQGSYSCEDVENLTGYDCMEVVSHCRNSERQWDAALSAGKAVWIVNDDDCHDIDSDGETGVCWTMVQSRSLNLPDIVEAMKLGKTYGVVGFHGQNDNRLRNVLVNGMSIEVTCDSFADEIRFVGQDGILKKVVRHRLSATYSFAADDTYIRTLIQSPHSTMLLNPVIRCDGTLIATPDAQIDYRASILYSLFAASACFTPLFLRRRRSRKPSPIAAQPYLSRPKL